MWKVCRFTPLNNNNMSKTQRYIGTCLKHGLVRHETLTETFDLKGGAFCPYCGSLLSGSKKDSPVRVSRGKEVLPTPFFERTQHGWAINKEAKS